MSTIPEPVPPELQREVLLTKSGREKLSRLFADPKLYRNGYLWRSASRGVLSWLHGDKIGYFTNARI